MISTYNELVEKVNKTNLYRLISKGSALTINDNYEAYFYFSEITTIDLTEQINIINNSNTNLEKINAFKEIVKAVGGVINCPSNENNNNSFTIYIGSDNNLYYETNGVYSSINNETSYFEDVKFNCTQLF